MKQLLLFIFSFIAFSPAAFAQKNAAWHPAPNPIMTTWGEQLNPNKVWQEYPRPQMKRERFEILNGLWEYAIVPAELAKPLQYDGQILVPFCVESALSGVKKSVSPQQRLWYKRSIKTSKKWKNGRVLLNFEAVDWESTVYIDGKEVGKHRGGYDPFSFDITAFVNPGKKHTLTVAIYDPTDAPDAINPRGKQVLAPNGIYYTPVTGIWQTVWMEHVPDTYIEDYHLQSDIDKNTVTVEVNTKNILAGDQIQVIVRSGENRRMPTTGTTPNIILAQQTITPGKTAVFTLKNPQLWSPISPYLYHLDLRIVRNKKNIDAVAGYFGMRKISLGKGKDGIVRLLLNNEPVFQNGPLDQGFWPDGIYTPPSVQAMRYDLEQLKSMGFNMLRKHVKVEPRIFYRQADEIGLLVWQDMPSTNGYGNEKIPELTFSAEHSDNFKREIAAMVKTHWNYPCIVIWVPFNEGWGQHRTREFGDFVKKLDPDRLVNFTSGWTDMGGGDMLDIHHYPDPALPAPQKDRAIVLGEFGGLGLKVEDHTWQKENWGYQKIDNKDDLLALYGHFYRSVFLLRDTAGLSACVYTQTTDVETETNGLMTYDRKVIKMPAADLAAIHNGYFAPEINTVQRIFLDKKDVGFLPSQIQGVRIRYTLDGSEPLETSTLYTGPITIGQTSTIKARSFFPDGQKSAVKTWTLEKVKPKPGVDFFRQPDPQLKVQYFEGGGNVLADFKNLKAIRESLVNSIDLAPAKNRESAFALTYTGYIAVPKTGIYTFYLLSDDGSALDIGQEPLITHDGLHGDTERTGDIALQKGYHHFKLTYFQNLGGKALKVMVEGPGMARQEIPSEWMFH